MFFDDTKPRQLKKKKFEGELRVLDYPKQTREFSTDPFNEFEAGDDVAVDTECYKNYWLCMFKHLASGKYFYIEMQSGEQLNVGLLNRALYYFRIITFNGRFYDLPMIESALLGNSTEKLKEHSDEIIQQEKRIFRQERFNHIDIIEVAPLPGISLKTYGARLHSKRLQDLPIKEWKVLTEDEIQKTRDYCCNDCDVTGELFAKLKGPIELRESLSDEYDQDLRSKSDAQIAEAVICSELEKIMGRQPKRKEFDEDFCFFYKPPNWMSFDNQEFAEALETIKNAPFILDKGGSPKMPKEIAGLKLKLGKSTYKLGMGGLHSSEKSVTHRSTNTHIIIDRDVASYYPFIVLNNEYYPQHLGTPFLEVYRSIVERRLHAKKMSKIDKNEAAKKNWAMQSDGLKITINGTFGKLGNRYSAIYSPDLMIQVTVTGQLALLMLIERVEAAEIPVVSANTDGIVINCPRDRENDLNAIIALWESLTKFETEETRYRSIHSRDVNNYVAVKEDGECKAKGVYSERGSALNSVLSKNPEYLVCNDALEAFLSKGIKPEETITNCSDIRRFVSVRNVRGGGHKDGVYLGKVVRWYFAKDQGGTIDYILSGNKVPKSDGAKPLMQLDGLPNDIDYDKYIRMTYEMIDEVGYYDNKSYQENLL